MRTAEGTVVLVAPTEESLELSVYSDADPTATAPTFTTTTAGTVVTGSETYQTGSWVGSYGSDGWTTVRTPTLGTLGALTLTAHTRVWLWIKCVRGSETAVWRVGTVVVP